MLERIPFLYAYFRAGLLRNSTRWLAPFLIAGLLLFSIALPLLPAQRFVIYLPVLVAGAFIALAFIRWPGLGLVALIAASLLVPFAIGTGSETSINVTIMLLVMLIGLWVLDMVAYRRQIWLVESRTMRPLAFLLAVVVISFLIGLQPWFPFARQSASLAAQLGGLFLFFLSVGAFILVANQIREIRWLEWMTWVFVGLGGVFIAGWLLPFVGTISSRIFQYGAIDGGMFWTWLVALAFSQALINKKIGRGWRLVLAAIAGATLFVGLFMNNGWKSGYIPPVAAVATIIAFRSWRVGLGLALVGLAVGSSLVSSTIASDQYSYSTRVEAGVIILDIVKSSPIFGFGPANYYWYTPLFPIRGYAVEFNSHNQYIDIIAQIGFLGLAILLWFFVELGLLAVRLRNQVQEGFEQAYVYGVIGGLVGTLVAGVIADWFIPFVYNVGYRGFRASVLAWIFMGGLVSLEAITRRRGQSQQTAIGN